MQKISLLRQFYVMFNHCLNFLESNTFYAPPFLGLESNDFFGQFMVEIMPLGSMDPHIFTDPDPKHSLAPSILTSFMNKKRSNPFYPKGPIIIKYKKIRIEKKQRLPGMK